MLSRLNLTYHHQYPRFNNVVMFPLKNFCPQLVQSLLGLPWLPWEVVLDFAPDILHLILNCLAPACFFNIINSYVSFIYHINHILHFAYHIIIFYISYIMYHISCIIIHISYSKYVSLCCICCMFEWYKAPIQVPRAVVL